MTKEEFYKLATTRKPIKDDSIYKLTIRELDNNVLGFIKEKETDDWGYEISCEYNWYTTKEKATEYMIKYIHEKDSRYRKRIHSALIERIPANIPVEDGGQLEWWFYDQCGKEIDRSVCTWELKDEPSPASIYYGRKLQEIRFQMEEIVEIISDNKIFLSVINGLPNTIEEMWKLFEEREKKLKKNMIPNSNALSLYDAMADMYFYIQSNGFDPDTSPYCILKPTFLVPEKAEHILTSRYNCWKSYIDSHTRDKINWDELYKMIQGIK